MTLRTVHVIGPTGAPGVLETVHVLANVTGPTGQYEQCLQSEEDTRVIPTLIDADGATGPFRTIVIDGYAGPTGSTGPAVNLGYEGAFATKTSGGSTIAVNYTTDGADRVGVICIYNAWNPTGISSITDSNGNTWTRRAHVVSTDTSISVDIWWAHIVDAGAGTATINASSSISQAVDVSFFAVSGAADPSSPWDSNVSLPAGATDTDVAIDKAIGQSISTDAAKSLIFGFYGTRATTQTITADTGWTALPTQTDVSNPGGHYISGIYQIFDGAQSSLDVKPVESTRQEFLFVVDAIAGS